MLDKKGWWPGLWKQRSLWICVLCTFFQSSLCHCVSVSEWQVIHHCLTTFLPPTWDWILWQCRYVVLWMHMHISSCHKTHKPNWIHFRYYSDLPCSLHFTDWKVSPCLFCPRVFLAGTNLVLCSFCTVRENSCIINIFLNFFDHVGLFFSPQCILELTSLQNM